MNEAASGEAASGEAASGDPGLVTEESEVVRGIIRISINSKKDVLMGN